MNTQKITDLRFNFHHKDDKPDKITMYTWWPSGLITWGNPSNPSTVNSLTQGTTTDYTTKQVLAYIKEGTWVVIKENANV